MIRIFGRMCKKIFLALSLSLSVFVIWGQKPSWTSSSERERSYPSQSFFTGYIEGNVRSGETVEEAKNRLLKDAQGSLSEKIRMTVKSETTSSTSSVKDRVDTEFSDKVQTSTDVEIVGIHSEASYHDTQTGIVYAFAYVNRSEFAGYHKASLNMNLTQTEGLLQTAQDLVAAGEKAKARQQCETAKALLEKVRSSQDLLTAISPGISSGDLQQTRTETIHNRLTQMQAQLAQAILVYMECAETNLSKQSTVLANKLKSTLSIRGCGFTDDRSRADFRINISATTRQLGDTSGSGYGFSTCYADVKVNMIDTRKNISVFQDEFSQRGIANNVNNNEIAGRNALESAASVIAEKISQWIE